MLLKGMLSSSLVVLLMIAVEPGATLDCVTCEWDSSAPLDVQGCYSYMSVTPPDIDTPVVSCPSYTFPYCRTRFTFTDGIVTNVARECIGGEIDDDDTTDQVPEQEQCVSNFDPASENIDVTTCYLPCNNFNGCNNQNIDSLMLCDVNCLPNGRCNYLDGTCVCNEGYIGDTCSTMAAPDPPTYISCLQCDSDTNDACEAGNVEASRCTSGGQRFCAVSSVTTFDQDLNEVRSFVSRSCAESYAAADECFITHKDFNGLEYTCVASCDTNECNTGTPNGMDDVRKLQPLRCVVCDSADGLVNCAYKSSTEVCPSSATHCTSTVTYFVSEKLDVSFDADPEYLLESVVRSCASDPIETKCSGIPVDGATSLIRTTCTESCAEDGCNTGWPSRPKCSQCSCSGCSAEDDCVSNPPPPTMCAAPFLKYCALQDFNRDKSGNDLGNGYSRFISRNCSHFSIGNTCSPNHYSDDLEDCYKTCETDGCNLGFAPYPVVVPSDEDNGSSILWPNYLLTLPVLAIIIKIVM